MGRLLRAHPGAVSHVRGTAAGIPQHLRGQPQIILDTTFTGADLDISAAGTHTIEGVSWVTDGAFTSAIAGSDGLVLDWQTNNTTVNMSTDLGTGISSNDELCVWLAFEPLVMGTGTSIGVSLQQADGATLTEHDVRVALKHTPRFQAVRRGASSSTVHYFGDNPWGGGGMPAAASIMMWASGYGLQARCSTSLVMPAHRGLVAVGNAETQMRTRASGASAGDFPTRRYLNVFLYDTQMKARIKALRVWRL